jgi:hypothetical protein
MIPTRPLGDLQLSAVISIWLKPSFQREGAVSGSDTPREIRFRRIRR